MKDANEIVERLKPYFHQSGFALAETRDDPAHFGNAYATFCSDRWCVRAMQDRGEFALWFKGRPADAPWHLWPLPRLVQSRDATAPRKKATGLGGTRVHGTEEWRSRVGFGAQGVGLREILAWRGEHAYDEIAEVDLQKEDARRGRAVTAAILGELVRGA